MKKIALSIAALCIAGVAYAGAPEKAAAPAATPVAAAVAPAAALIFAAASASPNPTTQSMAESVFVSMYC